MATRQEIAKETNARFWVTTQYKPGEPLNPDDETDRQHIRTWLDIFNELGQQNARGELVLTYTHPSFAQSLEAAIAASQIERSINEYDPRYTESRSARAQAFNDAALWQDIAMTSRAYVGQALVPSNSSSSLLGFPSLSVGDSGRLIVATLLGGLSGYLFVDSSARWKGATLGMALGSFASVMLLQLQALNRIDRNLASR